MELKQFREIGKKIKQFFEAHEGKNRCLRSNISQQGFYGPDEPTPKVFKPGELISKRDIQKYKIPNRLFVHPDSLRNMGAFKFAAERKNIFSVGIIRTIKGLGDVLILSVIGKALKEQYPGKVKVWFAVHPGHEVLLENNPYIDKVFTSEKKLMEANPDIHLNVNDLEFKTELRKDEKIVYNRTKLYLDKMGLSVENKTPTYIVTEEEKLIAQKTLKKLGYNLKKSIIGIQLYGSNISKTYPHMKKVVKRLKEQKHQIFYLDKKPYKYGLREIAAITNEMTLIVTPNSFFYHLAGALRKRAVALFGYTDGKIWTEDYERVTPVQIPCPLGKERCWWRIECVPGLDLAEKETKAVPKCLSEIPVEMVINEVSRHLLKSKKILILVLTYNCLNFTKRMMESVKTFYNYDLFVVDNVSIDGTQKWLKKQEINYISKQLTVCQACNVGLKKAWEEGYDYMMLCSNDVILEDNYIDTIIETAERRKSYLTVGKVFNSEALRNANYIDLLKKIEKSTVRLEGGGFSATLISRECMEKIGQFDERFYPRYQEDEDYLLRVRMSGHAMVETYATSMLHGSGGVVKNNPEEAKHTQKNWNRNVAVFTEKWAINPYNEGDELHNLDRIKIRRPKWKKEIKIPIPTAQKPKKNISAKFSPIDIIEERIRKSGRASVLVIRHMGGFGDALFMTVIARALKKRYGNKIYITYIVPEKFAPVLDSNSNIDRVFRSEKTPSIIPSGYDTVINLTDYEYRVEMDEIKKHGEVRTPRTQIYLKRMGLNGALKPDYFVTEEEKIWADEFWKKETKGKKQKIAIIYKGSNMMKTWLHMVELEKLLRKRKFRVLPLQCKNGASIYTFRHVVAAISRADLMVGVDTGLTNLAGALGVPVISIFSHWNGAIPAKMFKSMIPIQGKCPHFPNKNYCGLKAPCFPGGLEDFRKKEFIAVPPCLENLSAETILKRVLKVLK